MFKISVLEIVLFIILGIILGMVGQGARAVVGIKKRYDKVSESREDWFDAKLLMISLMIGGIAGALGAIALLDRRVVDRQTLLTLITIGYAGTDFIEGFMRKSLPD
ncbi:MAG TPA: hypothetical protein VFC70_00880 [Oscillospiraceae bacterium]|nr:hypothetical protein [Oscillospiraceae bacterium]